MAPGSCSRRQAATLLAAGLLWPRAAQAIQGVDLSHITASHLPASSVHTYTPSGSLQGVADLYRRMTIPIRINDQGPFPFVVDTGANQSVISLELAAQLSLPAGPLQPLNGVAGIQSAPSTQATLQIGRRTQIQATLSMLPATSLGAPGMLGLDSLEGQTLTLDFGGEALRIDDGRHGRADPDSVAVKARRRDGQLTLVDADLAGIKVVAFLDSGAQNTIGNMALRALAATRSPTSQWTRTPIVSATGQTIDAEWADLPRLRVGGLDLAYWPVAFADLHTFRMWNLVQQPAILLGVDVLSRFQSVCLDFARDEVRFHLPNV